MKGETDKVIKKKTLSWNSQCKKDASRLLKFDSFNLNCKTNKPVFVDLFFTLHYVEN